MKRYLFFMLTFLQYHLILSQDFDGIEKSKLLKIVNSTEGEKPFKTEYYEMGTIQYKQVYGYDVLIKTISSDTAVYEQHISNKTSKNRKSLGKESFIVKMKNENGNFVDVNIKHGEFISSNYINDVLVSEQKKYYLNGLYHGKQTDFENGKIILENTFKMGIPNGVEFAYLEYHPKDSYSKYRGEFYLNYKGNWLNGEKTGIWESHMYLTVKEYVENRKFGFSNFYFNLLDTSILVKCIESNFAKEINSINQNLIDLENARKSDDEGYYERLKQLSESDTSSLIEIVETREYFPDGTIDEQILFENEVRVAGEGEIYESSNKVIDGSLMIRLIKDEDYYPTYMLSRWQQSEDSQKVLEEKLIYQSETPLTEDGCTKAFKQSKLIKIEIFVNGKLFFCEGDCE